MIIDLPSALSMQPTNRVNGIQHHPLVIPAGWSVEWNSFYAIDPDASFDEVEKLGLLNPEYLNGKNADREDIDLWQDVLATFFDSSWLWLGHRNDYACAIALEWTPMAEKHGCYWLTEKRSRLITFSQEPKKRIRRTVENTKICYEAKPSVSWSSEVFRELESRSRQEIVDTMNQ